MKKTSLMVLALLVATLAHGQVLTITSSPTAPTDHLLFSQPIATGGYAWNGLNGASGRRDIGQAFMVSESAPMHTVTLRISGVSNGALSAGFSLKLFSTATYHQSLADGTLLETYQATLPATIAPGDYMSFTFPTPVNLVADTFYTLIFSFNEQASLRTLSFAQGDNTTNGHRWSSSDGVNYTRYANPKLTLYVQTIPEATSGLLLGSAAVALGIGTLLRRSKTSARP